MRDLCMLLLRSVSEMLRLVFLLVKMLRREPTRVDTYADAMEEYKAYLEEKGRTNNGASRSQPRKDFTLTDQDRLYQETRSRIGLISKQ
nr:AlNc14C62G4495 [Albugo laibachii Nc14]|eukprot:CCA19039.1 AlNc14C62G4495 [Albugo laibachii Nc14]